MFLTAVPLALASLLSLVSSEEVVKVQFFGEAQCPFCRKFVQEAWPSVWEDSDLMQYVQYDFVAWGNAYFQIQKCSRGDDTYNADERKCWYANCSPIDRQGGNAVQYEDDCFSGKVIYQHSAKEGQVSGTKVIS
jgi:Gamma interferon inducible lysosomal thiol reductase (GILT)